MKPLFVFVREADTDLAGLRYKLGLSNFHLPPDDAVTQPEISFKTINQLVLFLREAVIVPMDPEIARLRAAVENNFDFSMEITPETALRLGFFPQP